MPRYKWDSPADWLGDKINEHASRATVDTEMLAHAIMDRCGISPARARTVVPAIQQLVNQAIAPTQAALADIQAIANTIVNGTLEIDSDTIQNAFQDEMDEDGFFRDLDICNDLSREACVELLEGVCIECRDDEDVATLRAAVEANIEDGTLAYSDVESAAR